MFSESRSENLERRLLGIMLKIRSLLVKVAMMNCRKWGSFAIGTMRVMKFHILHLLGKDGMNLYPTAKLTYLTTSRALYDQPCPPQDASSVIARSVSDVAIHKDGIASLRSQ